MSTIDELERRARTIAVAERDALCDLANYMRELAVGLPDGSRVALLFAEHAHKFEDRANTAYNGLQGLHWDLPGGLGSS